MQTTTTTTLPTCPYCAGSLTETWRSANGYAVRAECEMCWGAWQFYRRSPAFPFWIVAYVLKHPRGLAELRLRCSQWRTAVRPNNGFHLTAAPVGLWDNVDDSGAAAAEP